MEQATSHTKIAATPATRLMALTNAMIWSAHQFMHQNDFVDVTAQMPILVGVSGACENVDTLYKVTPSPSNAGHSYLAQSGQLYLEVHTNSFPSGRVYCMIPSHRAELDVDNRHLNAFPLWELEMNGDLNTLLGYIESTVKTMIKAALTDPNGQVLIADEHQVALANALSTPWPQLRYEEAVAVLQKNGFAVEFGDDLKAPHELYLASKLGPHFLTHFPLEIKFFNMMQNADDSRLVNSADLILPLAGESAGAAEREHTYDRLVYRLKNSPMYQRLIALGGTDKDFAWYLDHFKTNQVPLHAGTGLGISRIIQYVLGSQDIHTSQVYPVDAVTVW